MTLRYTASGCSSLRASAILRHADRWLDHDPELTAKLEEGDAEAVAEGLAVDLGLDANGRGSGCGAAAAGWLRSTRFDTRLTTGGSRTRSSSRSSIRSGRSDHDAREIEERGGLTVTERRTMMPGLRAAPRRRPLQPFLTAEEDKHSSRSSSASASCGPRRYRTQVGRVYGQSSHRIAQTEIDLFAPGSSTTFERSRRLARCPGGRPTSLRPAAAARGHRCCWECTGERSSRCSRRRPSRRWSWRSRGWCRARGSSRCCSAI